MNLITQVINALLASKCLCILNEPDRQTEVKRLPLTSVREAQHTGKNDICLLKYIEAMQRVAQLLRKGVNPTLSVPVLPLERPVDALRVDEELPAVVGSEGAFSVAS